MDLRKIKKLIELLEDSDLAEMEIREGEESIRLSRASKHVPTMVSAMPGMHAMAPAMNYEAPPTAPAATTSATADAKGPNSEGHVVTSPIVGTFYSSPNPESDAFVVPGSHVNVGDALCIIEAMKTFNPIVADCAGVVRAVLKLNGDPVEYGEPLVIIDQRHGSDGA